MKSSTSEQIVCLAATRGYYIGDRSAGSALPIGGWPSRPSTRDSVGKDLVLSPARWLGQSLGDAPEHRLFAYAVGGIMAFILVLSLIARTPQNAFICLEIFAITIVGMMHGILVAVRKTGFVLQRASRRWEAE